MTKRCLIIAGGTGGHIFPALAVAEILEKNACEIFWLGSCVGLEAKLVPEKYHLQQLSIKGIRGSGIIAKLLLPWRLFWAIAKAYRIIQRIKPDSVLAMGGYAAAPGGVAAWLARKKIIIHEQNAKAGLTNRYLAKLASVRLQAFEGALPQAITVGNPVRQNLFDLPRAKPSEPLKVLILGGSQGARPINRCILALCEQWQATNALRIWHQSGKTDFDYLQVRYQQLPVSVQLDPFITDMAKAYAWANIVIARAGAMTVSEIAAVGVASILIPYPYAADNHQYFNALSLSSAGSAILLPEPLMTVDVLTEYLQCFLRDQNELLKRGAFAKKFAFPNAAEKVANHCLA